MAVNTAGVGHISKISYRIDTCLQQIVNFNKQYTYNSHTFRSSVCKYWIVEHRTNPSDISRKMYQFNIALQCVEYALIVIKGSNKPFWLQRYWKLSSRYKGCRSDYSHSRFCRQNLSIVKIYYFQSFDHYILIEIVCSHLPDPFTLMHFA